jgi:ComF family protein
MRLLEFILDALLPPRETSRIVRTLTAETLARAVTPRQFASEHGTITGLLPYRSAPVRASILEAKFHANVHATAVLGRILGTHLHVHDGLAIVLVPVPLGAKRRRARGYNQVERICAAALPHISSTARLAPDILTRTRETTPQTELSGSARRENMRGAFAASAPLDHTQTYVIVDDVTTTGATLEAACDALRAAGARRIAAVALAY